MCDLLRRLRNIAIVHNDLSYVHFLWSFLFCCCFFAFLLVLLCVHILCVPSRIAIFNMIFHRRARSRRHMISEDDKRVRRERKSNESETEKVEERTSKIETMTINIYSERDGVRASVRQQPTRHSLLDWLCPF